MVFPEKTRTQLTKLITSQFDIYVHAEIDNIRNFYIENGISSGHNNLVTLHALKHVVLNTEERKKVDLPAGGVVINTQSKTGALICGLFVSFAESAMELPLTDVSKICRMSTTEADEKLVEDQDEETKCKILDSIVNDRKIEKLASKCKSRTDGYACGFIKSLIANAENVCEVLTEGPMPPGSKVVDNERELRTQFNAHFAFNDKLPRGYDVLVADTLILALKCLARAVANFQWYSKSPCTVNEQSLIGLLASHGASHDYITELLKQREEN